MGHEQSNSQPAELKAAANRVRAFKLRLAGHSYRAIAAAMECSLGAAHGYVMDELEQLKSETREAADHLRSVEIAKLDDLEVKMRRRLRGCDDADAAKIAAVIIKASESRRKLLGLDSAQKVEVTGNLYTVKEASPACSAWDSPGTGASADG